MATESHRSLPHCLEAEQAIIGLCLLDAQEVMPKAVMAGVGIGSFYDAKHGTVFGVMLDMFAAGQPIEASTLAIELKTRGELEHVGGYAFITQVSGDVPTTARVEYFIKRVKERETLREVIKACSGSVEACYEASADVDEVIAKVTRDVQGAANGLQNQRQEETVAEVCKTLEEDLGAPLNQRERACREVSWGLTDLDRLCGKLGPGTLNILAGRPSAGKSALSDQTAWSSAKAGKVTIVFSYEMPKADKVTRIVQQISRANRDEYDRLPMDRQIEFMNAVKEVGRCKALRIYERDNTLNKLIARVRATHQEEPVGLVVVDFLQRLSKLEPTIEKERTDEKIGRITTALSDLAKECKCPVLLLSAMNREGYKDGGARPTMSGLRNSGEIESDADVIAILHWPKDNPKTGQEQDPHDEFQNSFYVEFLQDKGRNKGVHQVGLMFDRKSTAFNCIT